MWAGFAQGGEILLTHSWYDGHLRVWHTGTGRELLSDPTFNRFAWDRGKEYDRAVRWREGRAEFWELVPGAECTMLPQGLHPGLGDISSMDVSPDGRLLAIGRGGGLELWDLVSRKHYLQPDLRYARLKFVPDGNLVTSG